MKKSSSVKIVLILLFLGLGLPIFSQNKEIPLWDKIPGAIEATDYKQ
jgi:hypothetical protein